MRMRIYPSNLKCLIVKSAKHFLILLEINLYWLKVDIKSFSHSPDNGYTWQ